MTSFTESPQARLVASREALVRQMSGDDGSQGHGARYDSDDSGDAADANRDTGHNTTWQLVQQAVMAWWQHHPAQIAIDVGRPFLNNYARDKPFQLLGIAVCAGAVGALVKPWRLVSITGLAVAALRSTRLTSTLISLIPRAASRSGAGSASGPDKAQHAQHQKDTS
jgi:hypothetical protein